MERRDLKPLHNAAYERAIIGCILTKPELFPQIIAVLKSDDFMDPLFASVFNTLRLVHADGKPIDRRFVLEALRSGADPEAAKTLVCDLLREQLVTANYLHYANRITDLAWRRTLVFKADDLADAAMNGDPEHVLSELANVPRRIQSMDTNMQEAVLSLADKVTTPGTATLIDLGIPDLDYSIGGGVEPGEFVVFAGRPSHGKSTMALQITDHWSSQGIPSLFVSEEMSAEALAKRVLLTATDVPQEHWLHRREPIMRQAMEHCAGKAERHITVSSKTVDCACDRIRRYVKEHGVKAVVIDYVQLLGAPGKSRYEQITTVSVHLRRLINETKITLIGLCQLNREIERREYFAPRMSDLKETGQLEQDADVIIFGVWPHRVDPKQPANKYVFYVAKNRNRAINQRVVECRFEPSRQRFTAQRPQDQDNYETAFDAFTDNPR